MEVLLVSLVAVIVTLAVAFGTRFLSVNRDTPTIAQSTTVLADSRFQKIITSGEIRCSYLIYSPYFRKDPNTGQLSGIFHDIMEEIGKRSSLKVVWVEEVGYETIFAGLTSGIHNVFCGGLWPNAPRAREGSFSIPVFYSVVKAWARSGETRFTNLDGVNNVTTRIAAIDGAMEDIIARTDFPKAERVSLPQQTPFTQSLLNITTNKADITFAEPGVIREFLAANPGTLKEIAPDRPLRIFGNVLVLPQREQQLKQFLDVALSELLYSGAIDRILERYEPGKGVFPRATLPYNQETAVLK